MTISVSTLRHSIHSQIYGALDQCRKDQTVKHKTSNNFDTDIYVLDVLRKCPNAIQLQQPLVQQQIDAIHALSTCFTQDSKIDIRNSTRSTVQDYLLETLSGVSNQIQCDSRWIQQISCMLLSTAVCVDKDEQYQGRVISCVLNTLSMIHSTADSPKCFRICSGLLLGCKLRSKYICSSASRQLVFGIGKWLRSITQLEYCSNAVCRAFEAIRNLLCADTSAVTLTTPFDTETIVQEKNHAPFVDSSCKDSLTAFMQELIEIAREFSRVEEIEVRTEALLLIAICAQCTKSSGQSASRIAFQELMTGLPVLGQLGHPKLRQICTLLIELAGRENASFAATNSENEYQEAFRDQLDVLTNGAITEHVASFDDESLFQLSTLNPDALSRSINVIGNNEILSPLHTVLQGLIDGLPDRGLVAEAATLELRKVVIQQHSMLSDLLESLSRGNRREWIPRLVHQMSEREDEGEAGKRRKYRSTQGSIPTTAFPKRKSYLDGVSSRNSENIEFDIMLQVKSCIARLFLLSTILLAKPLSSISDMCAELIVDLFTSHTELIFNMQPRESSNDQFDTDHITTTSLLAHAFLRAMTDVALSSTKRHASSVQAILSQYAAFDDVQDLRAASSNCIMLSSYYSRLAVGLASFRSPAALSRRKELSNALIGLVSRFGQSLLKTYNAQNSFKKALKSKPAMARQFLRKAVPTLRRHQLGGSSALKFGTSAATEDSRLAQKIQHYTAIVSSLLEPLALAYPASEICSRSFLRTWRHLWYTLSLCKLVSSPLWPHQRLYELQKLAHKSPALTFGNRASNMDAELQTSFTAFTKPLGKSSESVYYKIRNFLADKLSSVAVDIRQLSNEHLLYLYSVYNIETFRMSDPKHGQSKRCPLSYILRYFKDATIETFRATTAAPSNAASEADDAVDGLYWIAARTHSDSSNNVRIEWSGPKTFRILAAIADASIRTYIKAIRGIKSFVTRFGLLRRSLYLLLDHCTHRIATVRILAYRFVVMFLQDCPELLYDVAIAKHLFSKIAECRNALRTVGKESSEVLPSRHGKILAISNELLEFAANWKARASVHGGVSAQAAFCVLEENIDDLLRHRSAVSMRPATFLGLPRSNCSLPLGLVSHLSRALGTAPTSIADGDLVSIVQGARYGAADTTLTMLGTRLSTVLSAGNRLLGRQLCLAATDWALTRNVDMTSADAIFALASNKDYMCWLADVRTYLRLARTIPKSTHKRISSMIADEDSVFSASYFSDEEHGSRDGAESVAASLKSSVSRYASEVNAPLLTDLNTDRNMNPTNTQDGDTAIRQGFAGTSYDIGGLKRFSSIEYVTAPRSSGTYPEFSVLSARGISLLSVDFDVYSSVLAKQGIGLVCGRIIAGETAWQVTCNTLQSAQSFLRRHKRLPLVHNMCDTGSTTKWFSLAGLSRLCRREYDISHDIEHTSAISELEHLMSQAFACAALLSSVDMRHGKAQGTIDIMRSAVRLLVWLPMRCWTEAAISMAINLWHTLMALRPVLRPALLSEIHEAILWRTSYRPYNVFAVRERDTRTPLHIVEFLDNVLTAYGDASPWICHFVSSSAHHLLSQMKLWTKTGVALQALLSTIHLVMRVMHRAHASPMINRQQIVVEDGCQHGFLARTKNPFVPPGVPTTRNRRSLNQSYSSYHSAAHVSSTFVRCGGVGLSNGPLGGTDGALLRFAGLKQAYENHRFSDSSPSVIPSGANSLWVKRTEDDGDSVDEELDDVAPLPSQTASSNLTLQRAISRAEDLARTFGFRPFSATLDVSAEATIHASYLDNWDWTASLGSIGLLREQILQQLSDIFSHRPKYAGGDTRCLVNLLIDISKRMHMDTKCLSSSSIASSAELSLATDVIATALVTDNFKPPKQDSQLRQAMSQIGQLIESPLNTPRTIVPRSPEYVASHNVFKHQYSAKCLAPNRASNASSEANFSTQVVLEASNRYLDRLTTAAARREKNIAENIGVISRYVRLLTSSRARFEGEIEFDRQKNLEDTAIQLEGFSIQMVGPTLLFDPSSKCYLSSELLSDKKATSVDEVLRLGSQAYVGGAAQLLPRVSFPCQLHEDPRNDCRDIMSRHVGLRSAADTLSRSSAVLLVLSHEIDRLSVYYNPLDCRERRLSEISQYGLHGYYRATTTANTNPVVLARRASTNGCADAMYVALSEGVGWGVPPIGGVAFGYGIGAHSWYNHMCNLWSMNARCAITTAQYRFRAVHAVSDCIRHLSNNWGTVVNHSSEIATLVADNLIRPCGMFADTSDRLSTFALRNSLDLQHVRVGGPSLALRLVVRCRADVGPLRAAINDPDIGQFVSRCLRSAPADDIMPLLPQLVQALRYDESGTLDAVLCELAKKSMMLAHQLLWALMAESDTAQPHNPIATASEAVTQSDAVSTQKHIKGSHLGDTMSHGYLGSLSGQDPLPRIARGMISRLKKGFSERGKIVFNLQHQFWDEMTNISGRLKRELSAGADKDKKIMTFLKEFGSTAKADYMQHTVDLMERTQKLFRRMKDILGEKSETHIADVAEGESTTTPDNLSTKSEHSRHTLPVSNLSDLDLIQLAHTTHKSLLELQRRARFAGAAPILRVDVGRPARSLVSSPLPSSHPERQRLAVASTSAHNSLPLRTATNQSYFAAGDMETLGASRSWLGSTKELMAFPEVMRGIIRELLSVEPLETCQKSLIYLPTDPYSRVIEVKFESGRAMPSAAKCPYMLHFTVSSFEGPDKWLQTITKADEQKWLEMSSEGSNARLLEGDDPTHAKTLMHLNYTERMHSDIDLVDDTANQNSVKRRWAQFRYRTQRTQAKMAVRRHRLRSRMMQGRVHMRSVVATGGRHARDAAVRVAQAVTRRMRRRSRTSHGVDETTPAELMKGSQRRIKEAFERAGELGLSDASNSEIDGEYEDTTLSGDQSRPNDIDADTHGTNSITDVLTTSENDHAENDDEDMYSELSEESENDDESLDQAPPDLEELSDAWTYVDGFSDRLSESISSGSSSPRTINDNAPVSDFHDVEELNDGSQSQQEIYSNLPDGPQVSTLSSRMKRVFQRNKTNKSSTAAENFDYHAESDEDSKQHTQSLHAKSSRKARTRSLRFPKLNRGSGRNKRLQAPSGASSVTNSAPRNVNKACIFKVYDDIRQDLLAMQIIELLEKGFETSSAGLQLFPYRVVPSRVGRERAPGGILEVVPDARSMDDIGKSGSRSLFAHFLTKYGRPDTAAFEAARDNFLKSAAAYAIACYILWVKDRHNGNILINETGHMVHIDFGFLLGISPGGNLGFETAAFKLTQEMIDILGGDMDGELFQQFMQLCCRGMLIANELAPEIEDLVCGMADSGLDCFAMPYTLTFLRQRLRFGESPHEVAAHARGRVVDAANKRRTILYDGIQKLQQGIHSEAWQ